MLIILWCFISSFYEYQQGDHENDHDDGHGNVDNDHVIGPPGSSGFFLFFFSPGSSGSPGETSLLEAGPCQTPVCEEDQDRIKLGNYVLLPGIYFSNADL